MNPAGAQILVERVHRIDANAVDANDQVCNMLPAAFGWTVGFDRRTLTAWLCAKPLAG
jgi:hypothetical protein